MTGSQAHRQCFVPVTEPTKGHAAAFRKTTLSQNSGLLEKQRFSNYMHIVRFSLKRVESRPAELCYNSLIPCLSRRLMMVLDFN